MQPQGTGTPADEPVTEAPLVLTKEQGTDPGTHVMAAEVAKHQPAEDGGLPTSPLEDDSKSEGVEVVEKAEEAKPGVSNEHMAGQGDEGGLLGMGTVDALQPVVPEQGAGEGNRDEGARDEDAKEGMEQVAAEPVAVQAPEGGQGHEALGGEGERQLPGQEGDTGDEQQVQEQPAVNDDDAAPAVLAEPAVNKADAAAVERCAAREEGDAKADPAVETAPAAEILAGGEKEAAAMDADGSVKRKREEEDAAEDAEEDGGAGTKVPAPSQNKGPGGGGKRAKTGDSGGAKASDVYLEAVQAIPEGQTRTYTQVQTATATLWSCMRPPLPLAGSHHDAWALL